MRELEVYEAQVVCGAGFGDEFNKVLDAIKSITADDVSNFATAVYEGSIDSMSYVMGRVAGDLHPSYYL